MKSLTLIFFLFFLSSCDYMGLEKQILNKDEPIASLFDIKLYRKDIQNLIPKNISKEDSLIFVKSIINNWAVKQIILKKSLENSSSKLNNTINNLVANYKQSLLINSYKEQIIKQQLDTVIKEKELEEYYSKNKQNFKLYEELLKVKFLNFRKDLSTKKEVILSLIHI